MSKNIKKELDSLEELFRQNGYTTEMIEEIKLADDADNAEAYIDNLQSEQGYWDC